MHACPDILLQKPLVTHQLPSPFSSVIAPSPDHLPEQVPASFRAMHELCTRDSAPRLWGNFLVGWHRQKAKPGSWHLMLSCWAKAKRMWTGPFPSNYVLCLQICPSEILVLSFMLIGQNSISQIWSKTLSVHEKRKSWEAKVSHVKVWYSQYEPSC